MANRRRLADGRQQLRPSVREAGRCFVTHTAWLHHPLFPDMAPDVVTYTALIGAYGRAGMLERAVAVLEEMKAAGVRPNSWTFTTLLHACEERADLDTALDIMHHMEVRQGWGAGRGTAEGCALDLLFRAVLENPPFFLVRTAPRDHQPPPTANRQPPSTANHCSIPLLWCCVLPMS